MKLRFLLDTNVLAELGRANPDESTLRSITEHRAVIATAALVLHELRYGCARMPRSRKRSLYERLVEDVIGRLPILPYDAAAALWHADERARLEAAGRAPPDRDAQIASIAAANGLAVVTRNVRDFDRFRGLRVTSWHEP